MNIDRKKIIIFHVIETFEYVYNILYGTIVTNGKQRFLVGISDSESYNLFLTMYKQMI